MLAVGLVSVVASLSFVVIGLIGSGLTLAALSFGEFGVLCLSYAPVMVPVVTIAGLAALPLSALMVKNGLTGIAAYAVVGTAAGAIASVLIFGRMAAGHPANLPVWAAVGVLPGLTAGLFWWQTVVRRERAGAPA